MVKKAKAMVNEEDKPPASAAPSSAYEIWQAGLGAFAKAQQEGGRVFNLLVQEGAERQQRARSKAEEQVADDLSETIAKAAEDVSAQAAGAWDTLEQVFEERVTRALGSIGVPTRQDFEALTRQLEQLQLMVAKLSAQPAARGVAPASAPAAKAARTPAVKAAAKSVAKPAVNVIRKPAAPRKAAARKTGAGPATGA